MFDMESVHHRAVGYVRVSLERPGMISPDLQLAAIRAHCEQAGYELVTELADIDESGRRWDGRKIESAVTMIECGFAEVLVVARWSRLSRNRLDWALALERIERAGGRVESATEPVDATTSEGRFTRAIFAEQAAFESDRQGDYSRATHARRLREGLPLAGTEHFGYRKVGREYEPDPVMGKILAAMYRKYVAGTSFRAITLWLQDLDAKTPGGLPQLLMTSFGLAHALDSGFGAGKVSAHGIHHPGRHDPVISATMWARYQKARADRAYRTALTIDPDRFMFTGVAACGECGALLAPSDRREKSQITSVYVCRTQTGSHLRGIQCRLVLRIHLVEAAFLAWLRDLVADPGACAEARDAAQRLCASAHDQVRAAELQVSQGVAPNAEVEVLRLATGYNDPVQRAAELIDDWPLLDAACRRVRIRQLVDRIVVNPRRRCQAGRGTGQMALKADRFIIQPVWAQSIPASLEVYAGT